MLAAVLFYFAKILFLKVQGPGANTFFSCWYVFFNKMDII